MDKIERVDHNLELAVRYGIILDMTLGAVTAWAFMSNNGVSDSVILRVLSHVERRRDSDKMIIELAGKENKFLSREAVKAVFGVGRRESASQTC